MNTCPHCMLFVALALLTAACQVPGQPGEDREPYRSDAMGSPDGQEDTSGSSSDTLAPQVDAVAPDTRLPDATAEDAIVDSSSTADGDTHDGPDTADTPAPDVVDGPALGCFGELGSIAGRLCHGFGTSEVVIETERVDCNGVAWPLRVVVAGASPADYELTDLPPGDYVLEFTAVSFVTTVDVVVEAGRVTDPGTGRYCIDPPPRGPAVLTGMWDQVEGALDNLGVSYDLYLGDGALVAPDAVRSGFALLEDAEALHEYETLFINSGDWTAAFTDGVDAEPMHTRVRNLRNFVRDGGDLVVTDWGWQWVEAAWPGFITFVGDPPPDADGQAVPGLSTAAAVGSATPSLHAQVVDPVLAEHLGRDTLSLRYAHAAWIVPVDTLGEVRVTASSIDTHHGPRQDVPLVIQWRPPSSSRAGTVTFIAFELANQSAPDTEALLNHVLFATDD